MPKLACLAAMIAAMVVTPAFAAGPMNQEAVLISPEIARLKLTPPNHLLPASNLLVGVDSVPALPDLNAVAATPDDLAEWNLLRYSVTGPQGLDALGDMLDMDETERPWSTTTTVHLLAKFGTPVVPFFSVAHEVDALDNFDRFGLGGGMLYQLTPNAAITTEILYFNDQSNYNETLSRETRMMARLEIDF